MTWQRSQQVRDREGRYMANTIYLPTFRIRTCVPFPQYWMRRKGYSIPYHAGHLRRHAQFQQPLRLLDACYLICHIFSYSFIVLKSAIRSNPPIPLKREAWVISDHRLSPFPSITPRSRRLASLSRFCCMTSSSVKPKQSAMPAINHAQSPTSFISSDL